MATEPTQMITGDVMELHHLIYAERLAHAAEVNWYRRALCEIEKQTVEGKDLAVVNLMVQHALAAPPAEAVRAIEGVVTALESLLKMGDLVECTVCGHPLNLHLDRYGCEYEHFEAVGPCGCDGKSVSEDNTREIGDLRTGRAALAAYRAALGEKEEGRG